MVGKRSDGEATKRRIAAKAKTLFVHRGYGAVTMNEVCEAARVSKGSLYHHFPSKEELFLVVVEEDTERWRADWDRKRTGMTSIEDQLVALAEHYADDFQNPLFTAMEEFSRSHLMTDELVERLLRINDNASLACRDVLRGAMAKGELAGGDPDELAMMVTGMMEGLGKVYFTVDREREQERIAQLYRKAARLLLDGLRAR